MKVFVTFITKAPSNMYTFQQSASHLRACNTKSTSPCSASIALSRFLSSRTSQSNNTHPLLRVKSKPRAQPEEFTPAMRIL